MFNLEGEYLDWYTARYISFGSTLSWDDLKLQFLDTYTKPIDAAKDDLMRLTQKYNESAYDFLKRLR